jgi:tRNA(Arg) A34 adenosine deaminase TadA
MEPAAEHLERCIQLAEEALATGDEPFGSLLVAADGRVLAEDRNRTVSAGDPTAHPEFALARWAGLHLSPGERLRATVYTSGEHCPMCSAAHGWAGVGRIVYIHSSAQLRAWLAEFGVPPAPVRAIPVQDVVPEVAVHGPVAGLDQRMRDLHRRYHESAR